MGSVTITKPRRRLIYTNGNHDEASGTSPVSIEVEIGPNTFETLAGDGTVDFRGSVTITAANPNVELELEKTDDPGPGIRGAS